MCNLNKANVIATLKFTNIGTAYLFLSRLKGTLSISIFQMIKLNITVSDKTQMFLRYESFIYNKSVDFVSFRLAYVVLK